MNGAEAESPKTRMRRREKGRKISKAKQDIWFRYTET